MEKNAEPINYLEIFRNSWSVMWHNRYLWWFGLFVFLGNVTNFGYSFDDKDVDLWRNQQAAEFFSQNFHWVAAGFSLILLLSLAFFVFSLIGRGALIDSIEKQKEGKPANFKSGMKEGRKYFWKMLLVTLGMGLFVFSAVIVLVAPVAFLFFSQNYLAGTLMAVLAGLILIPLLVLAAYVKIYGYLYTVLGQLNFWGALENAYNLFCKNIGSSLIMGLLFIPICIALAMGLFLAAIPVAIVFLGIGIVFFLLAGKIGAIIVASTALLVFLVMMLFLRSAYEVFAQSVWIFFFHQIAKVKKEEFVAEAQSDPLPVPKSAMPVIEARKE